MCRFYAIMRLIKQRLNSRFLIAPGRSVVYCQVCQLNVLFSFLLLFPYLLPAKSEKIEKKSIKFIFYSYNEIITTNNEKCQVFFILCFKKILVNYLNFIRIYVL